jgi:DNA-directed RNA polymerase subunit RPC12/RpoP
MTGLFEQLPHRPPVKRMHVADAGLGGIRFKCAHCDHDTGWIADEHTVTENRRGLPCPRCNPEASAPEGSA